MKKKLVFEKANLLFYFTMVILILVAFQMPLVGQGILGVTTINISGKVLDASTLKPVSDAEVRFGSQKFTTTEGGHFFATVKVPSSKISFVFHIKKAGYGKLKDTENWGSENGRNIRKVILLIGIDKKDDRKQFMYGIPYSGTMQYADNAYVDSAFRKEKDDRNLVELSMLRDSIRANPDRIFFTINHLHFIATNSSYLSVDSEEDLVNVGLSTVKASELNKKYKRKMIVGMTTIESDTISAKVKLSLNKD